MAQASAKAAAAEAPVGKRVKASDPAYGDILDFLNDEAALLDDDKHREWLSLLSDDAIYLMPARKTVYRRDGRGFDSDNFHFNDNRMTLDLRVRRSVEVPSAFDRDPAPRIRRQISNVVVYEGANADEYAVTSTIVLFRNRFDNPHFDILPAKREDIIRKTADGLKLAKRTVLLDQAALGASYLNVFM